MARTLGLRGASWVISDRHQCIFVHIPRCAGTSIEQVIWPGPRTEEQLWMGFTERYRNRHQTGGLQHLLASQIRAEVGESRFSSYFKFAMVRNPFDRLVSQYMYMRVRPDLREFIGMGERASFSEYLASIRRTPHVQWEPQSSFLYDDDGTLLVDFVGRFERLAADTAFVFERLGLPAADLPHLNATERSTAYGAYYTDELRRRVEGVFADDLVRFDYRF